MSKLKILCLHGFGTNADFLEKQTDSLKKVLEPHAELYFVDGPFPAPHNFVADEKVLELIKGETRSWFIPSRYKLNDDNFFQSLDEVRKAFESKSDYYDGILGFSQGSMLMLLLLRAMQNGKIRWKILEKVRFCFFANGTHYRFKGINNDRPLKIPSIHFLSPEDFMFHKSLLATTQFINPIIIRHHYGHRLPKLNINEKAVIKAFIKAQKSPQDQIQFLRQSKL